MAASEAAASPDLVRLTNGGFFRGTVQEYVPGDYVLLLLPTGETRRIDGKDVAYAGPAAQDPGKTSAPAPGTPGPVATPLAPQGNDRTKPFLTIQGQASRIHFEQQAFPNALGQDQPLTLYLHTASATAAGPAGTAVANAFANVCTAPCDAELPAGTYTLALGQGSKPAVRVKEMVKLPAGSATLVGSYRSRAAMRVAGWIFTIGGAVAAGALIATAFPTDLASDPYDEEDSGVLKGRLVGGVVLGLMGLIGGSVMASRPDVTRLVTK